MKTEKNDAEDVPEVKKIKSEQEEKEEQLRVKITSSIKKTHTGVVQVVNVCMVLFFLST